MLMTNASFLASHSLFLFSFFFFFLLLEHRIVFVCSSQSRLFCCKIFFFLFLTLTNFSTSLSSLFFVFLSVLQPVYVILQAKSIREVSRGEDDTYTFTTDQGYGAGESLFAFALGVLQSRHSGSQTSSPSCPCKMHQSFESLEVWNLLWRVYNHVL